jgi:hypothetical protein
MKRVKTDWRASLSERTLEHLLRVEVESPSIELFDSKNYVVKYFETVRRPEAHKADVSKKRQHPYESDSDS